MSPTLFFRLVIPALLPFIVPQLIWAQDFGASVTPINGGVVINKAVSPKSLADLMGLKDGDVILRVNQKTIGNGMDLSRLIGDSGMIEVEYSRKGKTDIIGGKVYWMQRQPTKDKTFFLPGERFIPIFLKQSPNSQTSPNRPNTGSGNTNLQLPMNRFSLPASKSK
jgi:hypothetical protein